jgi:hypothetical protein
MGNKLEIKIDDYVFYIDFEEWLANKKFRECKEREFYKNARQIINERRLS